MNRRDSASAYQQGTAFGASPLGQVVALYDTILCDLRRALSAVDAGQVEQRVNAANHALIVIGELQSVLDFERGGDAARNLDRFYRVGRALLTQASVTSSREKFSELISMFARLRAAWSRIERSAAPAQSSDFPGKLQQPQYSFPQSVPLSSESPEGVRGGDWKA